MSTQTTQLTVDSIVEKLRLALRDSVLGHGSKWTNYDPHKLSGHIEAIIAEADRNDGAAASAVADAAIIKH